MTGLRADPRTPRCEPANAWRQSRDVGFIQLMLNKQHKSFINFAVFPRWIHLHSRRYLLLYGIVRSLDVFNMRYCELMACQSVIYSHLGAFVLQIIKNYFVKLLLFALISRKSFPLWSKILCCVRFLYSLKISYITLLVGWKSIDLGEIERVENNVNFRYLYNQYEMQCSEKLLLCTLIRIVGSLDQTIQLVATLSWQPQKDT